MYNIWYKCMWHSWTLLSLVYCCIGHPDVKQSADHDESPPRTPTGNAPSSESDIDMSSPNVSHDESLAKELSLKESSLAHRPKRRRFHESYNFNMKCPTPGCNSLGNWSPDPCFYDLLWICRVPFKGLGSKMFQKKSLKLTICWSRNGSHDYLH